MRNRAVSAARKLNIWDPVFLEHETDTYALLRRYLPIALTEYGSYGSNQRAGWFISRHPDVSAALGNPGLFSSSNQIPTQTLIPLELDPPLHTSYRRTLNAVFSLEVVGKLEPEICRDADELLDEMIERETFDFVEMFADPFPPRVFCRLIGLPIADGPRVGEGKNTLMHGRPGHPASARAAHRRAEAQGVLGLDPQGRLSADSYARVRASLIAELSEYFDSQIEARRNSPSTTWSARCLKRDSRSDEC